MAKVYEPASSFFNVRRIAVFIAVLLGVFFVGPSIVTRVDAAHVGIRVKLAGSSRGVQDIPIVTGWVFFNPLAAM